MPKTKICTQRQFIAHCKGCMAIIRDPADFENGAIFLVTAGEKEGHEDVGEYWCDQKCLDENKDTYYRAKPCYVENAKSIKN